jgi:menaquinone-specific isochorismate synthase
VTDPGPLLALLPSTAALAWIRHGEGLVGWGEAAHLRVSGPDRMATADRWWRSLVERAVMRDELGVPGSGPVAFGSFAFGEDESVQSHLVVPSVVVGRSGKQWFVTTVATGDELPALPNVAAHPTPPSTEVVFSEAHAEEWVGSVAEAVRRIGEGNLDKVVLARSVLARSAAPVDVRAPLASLAENYPGCWTFHVAGVLGATPELLVRLRRGLATSRVLAGTIRRTGHDAADLALAASLARSSKDLEEHEYAVRSVADGLATHCSSLNVPETPFVLHLPNVMHLATDVNGVVTDGMTSLELAAALHPSAAVCGTPTEAARAVIADLEPHGRGRYAGPVGWMDATGDGEWGIALRCAELDEEDPRLLRLFGGCGIVAGSDPQDELAESQAKLMPMQNALCPNPR